MSSPVLTTAANTARLAPFLVAAARLLHALNPDDRLPPGMRAPADLSFAAPPTSRPLKLPPFDSKTKSAARRSVIRVLPFSAEQGTDKQIACLHRRAVFGASKPAVCFTRKFVQERERLGRPVLPERDK